MSWTGGAFGERAQCVLAPNANMMTLDGTNTWVLREPGASRSIVVDPGPLGQGHLEAIRAAAGDIGVILLTHHHFDHSEGARELAEIAGCGVRALDPEYRLGSEGLVGGDVVEVDGLEVRVVATPGHTADSLSFVVSAERAVLTGDTVLGRGTTVVAHPDGELGAYLDSLDTLHALAEAQSITAVWPGHGPVIEDALTVLDYYRAHRRERLAQVRDALVLLEGGGEGRGVGEPSVLTPERSLVTPERSLVTPEPSVLTPEPSLARRIVEIVYADVDPILWPAAELSVRAQLAYLRERS